jgi:proton-coupled amino acid transporter
VRVHVFIAETVLQVIEVNRTYLWAAILLEIPLLTPLVWIRHVYKLSVANFIGIMCIIFGAVYIMYFDIYTMVEQGGALEMKPYISPDIALFLGTAIFTFEGIGTVIPIQQSMKDKTKFRKLLIAAIFAILAALTLFAVLGYAAFGMDVMGPITLNLKEDDPFTKVVLSLYALAVLFSYPLIVFPAVEILSKLAFKEGPVTL